MLQWNIIIFKVNRCIPLSVSENSDHGDWFLWILLILLNFAKKKDKEQKECYFYYLHFVKHVMLNCSMHLFLSCEK